MRQGGQEKEGARLTSQIIFKLREMTTTTVDLSTFSMKELLSCG